MDDKEEKRVKNYNAFERTNEETTSWKENDIVDVVQI